MKILIVGSGAREHALATACRISPLCTELYATPGNAGINQIALNPGVNADDIDGIVELCQYYSIDLVVVGPEQPLALGVVDKLNSVNIKAFGPSQYAAKIESSKSFARDLMVKLGIKGPKYSVFDDVDLALDFIINNHGPIVVKADGLAGGKGVTVCDNNEQAKQAVIDCMVNKIYGSAGDRVVLEEKLTGHEISVFGFADGHKVSELATAHDYKRLLDNDAGPNTGGMGSYSPDNSISPLLLDAIRDNIMNRIVKCLGFKGVLYCGLMVSDSSVNVLEFNCRLGDPEAQVILPRLVNDPVQLMLSCIDGDLEQVRWSSETAVGVVLASEGYPGDIELNKKIDILSDSDPILHAGTKLFESDLVTNGGRVLTVLGIHEDKEIARQRAYDLVSNINFNGMCYRTDIGG